MDRRGGGDKRELNAAPGSAVARRSRSSPGRRAGRPRAPRRRDRHWRRAGERADGDAAEAHPLHVDLVPCGARTAQTTRVVESQRRGRCIGIEPHRHRDLVQQHRRIELLVGGTGDQRRASVRPQARSRPSRPATAVPDPRATRAPSGSRPSAIPRRCPSRGCAASTARVTGDSRRDRGDGPT